MSTLQIYRELLANLPLDETFDWISSTFGPESSIIEDGWLVSRKDRSSSQADFDTLFDCIEQYVEQQAGSDPWKREQLLSGATTLPVTMVTKSGKLDYVVTRDTAAGISLFFDAYKNSTGKSPYRRLTMSLEVDGKAWSYNRQARESNYSFSIRVHKVRQEPYTFATYDFYNGFVSAATWLGVDHRKYADSLYQHINGNPVKLQM